MNKLPMLAVLATLLTACVGTASDDEFMTKIYQMDPNGPPTEVILKSYPKIDPDEVQIHFSYTIECEKPQDIGVLIGWGDKGQSRGEIIHDFQIRAAKYGANRVVYVGTVTSEHQLDDVLHSRSEYSLMRCP